MDTETHDTFGGGKVDKSHVYRHLQLLIWRRHIHGNKVVTRVEDPAEVKKKKQSGGRGIALRQHGGASGPCNWNTQWPGMERSTNQPHAAAHRIGIPREEEREIDRSIRDDETTHLQRPPRSPSPPPYITSSPPLARSIIGHLFSASARPPSSHHQLSCGRPRAIQVAS